MLHVDRFCLCTLPGNADDTQESDSDDDSDETMRRFLAFANRGRASGSGLPAILAQLNRAVEDADDSDAETADLFVSCVAGVIRQGTSLAACSLVGCLISRRPEL